MPEKEKLLKLHKDLAIEANSKAWSLLEKPDRNEVDNLVLIEAGYVSLFHWRLIGTAVHLQRGHWLMAHIFTILHQPELALSHARTCFDLTRDYQTEMMEFDLAYANESMARACALNKQLPEALQFYRQAVELGISIKDPEDRRIFLSDFEGGEWFNLQKHDHSTT